MSVVCRVVLARFGSPSLLRTSLWLPVFATKRHFYQSAFHNEAIRSC